MLNVSKIKGIIFDYGATIDSDGKHWAEVLWDTYTEIKVPVSKENFREAYVYGERYLALHPVIKPEHTFKDVLLSKTGLQINWLVKSGILSGDNAKISSYSLAISDQCYNFARSTVLKAEPILKQLAEKYPLVLVSNFYGNIEAVLADFGIIGYFNKIVESAIVGVRKPDPAIFGLGMEALNFRPEEVVVIGDSHRKDIVPAMTLGCQTIWIKGSGWEEESLSLEADTVIYEFSELKNIFQLN